MRTILTVAYPRLHCPPKLMARSVGRMVKAFAAAVHRSSTAEKTKFWQPFQMTRMRHGSRSNANGPTSKPGNSSNAD
jgi:hypothetical protein